MGRRVKPSSHSPAAGYVSRAVGETPRTGFLYRLFVAFSATCPLWLSTTSFLASQHQATMCSITPLSWTPLSWKARATSSWTLSFSVTQLQLTCSPKWPLANSAGKSLLFPKRTVCVFLPSNPFPRIIPKGLLAEEIRRKKESLGKRRSCPQAQC